MSAQEKKYYVYELAYPESMGGAVFYVGKGSRRKTWKGIIDRIDEHEKQATQPDKVRRWGRNIEKCQAIQSIWGKGEQIVKRKVFWTDTEQEAYNWESKLIEKYGIENLTNKFRGGKPRSDRFLVVGSTQSTSSSPSMTDRMPEEISLEDLADLFGVTKWVIQREVKLGKLKAFDTRGTMCFKWESIEEYMQNQIYKPQDPAA